VFRWNDIITLPLSIEPILNAWPANKRPLKFTKLRLGANGDAANRSASAADVAARCDASSARPFLLLHSAFLMVLGAAILPFVETLQSGFLSDDYFALSPYQQPQARVSLAQFLAEAIATNARVPTTFYRPLAFATLWGGDAPVVVRRVAVPPHESAVARRRLRADAGAGATRTRCVRHRLPDRNGVRVTVVCRVSATRGAGRLDSLPAGSTRDTVCRRGGDRLRACRASRSCE
jgi:hypothetical protein